jgi:CRP-like cAMP-binding protein
MNRHLENQLLSRLDRATLASLEPDLAVVHFDRGHVINESRTAVQNVYFPHGGVISCVVETSDGGAVETGMIGRDGQFGAGAVLDHRISLNVAVMQVDGNASVIRADRFRHLAQKHLALRELVHAYEQFFVAQVQQTAACNALHDVPTRTCKWLLRMHHLVGDDLPLTQEFLAQMMGVRRTSVTTVAIKLQEAGLIAYSRGRVHIKDIVGVREAACECDDAVNLNYDVLFEGMPLVA